MKKIEYTSALLREQYTHIEHASGLSIYVFPKKMTNTYALFATAYGSMNTDFAVGERRVTVPDGIAHFLEHKLFEAPDGSDTFTRFSALGADSNAYTDYDKTAYLFSCTENVDEALFELLTFVTEPHFTEESVARERGIIGEEIHEDEDSPWERAYLNLVNSLYHKSPVRNNVLGTRKTIAKITPELLYECYNENNPYDNEQIRADFNELYPNNHTFEIKSLASNLAIRLGIKYEKTVVAPRQMEDFDSEEYNKVELSNNIEE